MPELDLGAYARYDAALEAGRLGEAMGICDDLLDAMGDNAQVFAMIGAIRMKQNIWDDAVSVYDRAIELKPDEGAYWRAVSKAHFFLEHWAISRFAGTMGDSMEPGDADLMVNMAIAAKHIGGPDAAMKVEQCLLRALAYDINSPRAHMAMGEHLLLHGDFDAGWREYVWRKKLYQTLDPRPCSAEWAGQRLRGTLVIMTEGGFGDSIQFSRYIPYAAERCDEVVLACCPELQDLFSCTFPGTRVISMFQDFPPHAAHVGMIDLPGIFGGFPAPTRLLVPDAMADDRGDRFFNEGAHAFKVGICWRGRPTHKGDATRSMPPVFLLPLLSAPRCKFYSLQIDQTEHESALLRPWVQPLTDSQSWLDTAAHILNLDLVITVDTAMAHLAGTLGKPVWTLLAKHPEWRWMVDRNDTPWYRSMSLCRQTKPGDWASLLSAVRVSLCGVARMSARA